MAGDLRRATYGGKVVPTDGEVRRARELLRRFLSRTRLVDAPSLSRHAGVPVRLKLEAELPTGSFKVRGALYALASKLERGAVQDVVASSTGNHGAAVAWAARELGVRATIFLPRDPNPVKRARITELGARIVEEGPDLTAAFRAARQHAEREGAYLLNDATDPDLPAGPATIAVEILEQAPDTRVLVVPMGDTALIRGIAAAAKSGGRAVRIIGVQAARAPAYYLSWKEGRAVETETCDTIADGLATRSPEPENVAAIRALVDDAVLVDEDQLLAAVRHLLLEEHVVAEPAGAAATAAVLFAGPFGGPAVLLVTGANLSPDVLRRAALF